MKTTDTRDDANTRARTDSLVVDVPVAEVATSEEHVHGSVVADPSAGDDVDAVELVDVDAVEATDIRAADEDTVVLASCAPRMRSRCGPH